MTKKIISFLMIGSLLILGCGNSESSKTVSLPEAKSTTEESALPADNTMNWLGGLPPDEALTYMKEHYAEGLVIVEVNTDYWKLKTGFQGALHIPHDEMTERFAEIPKGKPVILHCGKGIVSVDAYKILQEKRKDIPQLSYIAGAPPVKEFNDWLKEHAK